MSYTNNEDIADQFNKHFINVGPYLASKIANSSAKQRRALKIIFPNFSYQQALDQANLTFLVDRRISICKKLMANMRNEDHPISFLAPQAMTRFIPYQLRSVNTKAITTVKRTKRANDFFTFRYS